MGQCAFRGSLQSDISFSLFNDCSSRYLCELDEFYDGSYDSYELHGRRFAGVSSSDDGSLWHAENNDHEPEKSSSATTSELYSGLYPQQISPMMFLAEDSINLAGENILDTVQPMYSSSRSREYICMECQRGYSNSYKLELHAKAENHKAYQCKFLDCKRSYSRRDSYNRHIAGHRGSGHHSCDTCAQAGQIKTFKRRDNLIQHERSCHLKEPSRSEVGNTRIAGTRGSSSNTMSPVASHSNALETTTKFPGGHALVRSSQYQCTSDLRTYISLPNKRNIGPRRRTDPTQIESIRMTDITNALKSEDGCSDEGIIQCIKTHFPSDNDSLTLKELATGIGRLAECAIMRNCVRLEGLH